MKLACLLLVLTILNSCGVKKSAVFAEPTPAVSAGLCIGAQGNPGIVVPAHGVRCHLGDLTDSAVVYQSEAQAAAKAAGAPNDETGLRLLGGVDCVIDRVLQAAFTCVTTEAALAGTPSQAAEELAAESVVYVPLIRR